MSVTFHEFLFLSPKFTKFALNNKANYFLTYRANKYWTFRCGRKTSCLRIGALISYIDNFPEYIC